jgi:hypothetical protein
MLQISVPDTGAMVPLPNGKKVWMNPQRDLLHAFPNYIDATYRALKDPESPSRQWYAKEGGTFEELNAAYGMIVKFSDACARQPIPTLEEAVKESGYAALPLRARLVVGQALLGAMLGAYYKGCAETGGPATVSAPRLAE